jgi:hypothetical protein
LSNKSQQTGGYGQLGRSYGLLGDYVRIVTVVDVDGHVKDVTKSNDPELFYAILGGSPGNFAVITHITIEANRDADVPGGLALGMKAMWLYDKPTLKRLMDILTQMSDDNNFPRNYDLCVSVLSSSFKLLDLFPEADGMMRLKHPEIYGKDGIKPDIWPRIIIVYAQYVPFGANDPPIGDVLKWFANVEQGSFLTMGVQSKPLSKMTGDWICRPTHPLTHYPFCTCP